MHDDPVLQMLEANVWDAIDELETPPSPHEGHIESVDFGYVDPTAKESDRRACQACGAPVSYAEPHVRATVWVKNAVAAMCKSPIFCDRDCWTDWASQN